MEFSSTRFLLKNKDNYIMSNIVEAGTKEEVAHLRSKNRFYLDMVIHMQIMNL